MTMYLVASTWKDGTCTQSCHSAFYSLQEVLDRVAQHNDAVVTVEELHPAKGSRLLLTYDPSKAFDPSEVVE